MKYIIDKLDRIILMDNKSTMEVEYTNPTIKSFGIVSFDVIAGDIIPVCFPEVDMDHFNPNQNMEDASIIKMHMNERNDDLFKRLKNVPQ